MKIKLRLFILFFLTVSFGFLFTKNALADTVTLSGTVQTSSGSAIGGATVTINDANNDSTTTDPTTGAYSLSVPSGTYNVQVTPPSGSNLSSAIALNQNITANTVLNFALVNANSIIFSGTLYNSQGAALSGQTVSLVDSNGNATNATTDSSGNYSLTVSPGSYNINISGGSSNQSLDIPQSYQIKTSTAYSLTQSTLLNITLPFYQVGVQVLNASETPLSGVELSTSPGPTGYSNAGDGAIKIGNDVALGISGYSNITTDSSGNAILWLLPNDTNDPYTFTATPPNGSGYSTFSDTYNITSNTSETITLQQNQITFSGTLYNSQGTALSGQTVSLVDTNGHATNIITNSSGGYSFTVSPGSYNINVSGGSSNQSLDIPQSYQIKTSSLYSLTQSTVLNITLPFYQVNVQVQNSSGSPISSVKLSTSPGPTGYSNAGNGAIKIGNDVALGLSGYSNISTDSSGDATLWLLPNDVNDPYTFTATPPSGSGYSTFSSTYNITSNTPETITLQQNQIAFSGTLYNSQGVALSGQTVSLTNSNGNTTTATTNSSGGYSLTVSPGSYTISVSGGSSNQSLDIPQSYQIKTSTPYSLTQSTSLNITLPFYKVSVQVLNASGSSVSGVNLSTSPGPTGYSNAGNGAIEIGNDVSLAISGYSNITTDSSGNAILWLLPNDANDPYTFTATPPNGSGYSTFNTTVSVTSNENEVISLQYNHATPVTTAALSPNPYSDGTYPDPTTVTLSATAASGYTVANTYYTVNGGSQQTYSSPFTVSGAGSHTITYWSVDNSGVQEAANTKTFTITEAYSLTGIVYNDANKDGVQDPGEQGYAGATVTLNTGQSTTTDSNGNYSFSNLESGTYVDTLSVPSGYFATTTNPVTVPLAADTTVNFGIAQQQASPIVAINAGGDTQGNYAADTDYSGGTTYATTDSVDTSNVDNPAPQAVYQSVRYGNFTYIIPNLTANGTYTVRLHFNELYWNAAGQRTFNTSIDGTQVLSNFDIYQTAGGKDKAIVEQFPATADSNGNITIQFSSVTDNAMVNGIEVYNGTLPSPTPTPSPTPVQSASINAGGDTSGDYQADNGYTGGSTYSTTASIDTSNVTDPAPQSVYQTVRYGNFSYTIPTNSPNTNYTVRLDFSEPYWNAAGQRLFNVAINGVQDLSDFDVYQAAGGENKAISEQFTTTTDSDGLIHIQFNSVTDNAMVSGIAVSQQ